MTACAYIAPPDKLNEPEGVRRPIIIADTLVSVAGQSPDARRRVPATIQSDSKPNARLTRKISFVGGTAVAFAGYEWAIKICLEELSVKLTNGSRQYGSDKVFPWLTDSMNRLNEQYRIDHSNKTGREILSNVVYGLGVEPGLYGIDTVMGPPPFWTYSLGPRCTSIGSGAEYLEEECKRFRDVGIDSRDGFNRALEFVAGLNARRLAEEILGTNSGAWGGYFEMAHLSSTGWSRGPKCLHAFVGGLDLGGGKFTLRILGRFVAYSPGDADHSRVLTIWQEPGAEPYIGDFPIPNILGRAEFNPPDTSAFWTNFDPEVLTVTVLLKSSGPLPMRIIILPTKKELDFHLSFDASGAKWTINIDKYLIDQLGEALPMPNHVYVP